MARIIKPVTLTFVSSTAADSSLPAWNALASYTLGDQVVRNTVSPPKEYELIAASNTGSAPELNPTVWAELDATNPYRCLVDTVSSQTADISEWSITLNVTQQWDRLCLFRIEGAAQVHVEIWDNSTASNSVYTADGEPVVTSFGKNVVTAEGASGGADYDETFSLYEDRGVDDWYGYFYNPFTPKTNEVIEIQTGYTKSQIRLTFTGSAGDTVKVGHIVIGASVYIGCTTYGARVGFQDYSRREVNDYGEIEFTERDYAPKAQYDIKLPTSYEDAALRAFISARGGPAVFDMNPDDSTVMEQARIYGICREAAVELRDHGLSYLSVDILGLT